MLRLQEIRSYLLLWFADMILNRLGFIVTKDIQSEKRKIERCCALVKKILGRIIIVIPAIALQALWYLVMLGFLNNLFDG